MSPQVAHVFNDKLSKNAAFNITLKDTQATHAYDFNKLYASILRCCGDDFGWCQYIPTDYIEPFDGQVTTGPSSLATQARLVVTVSLGVGCWVLGGVDLMSYGGMSLVAVPTYPSMW